MAIVSVQNSGLIWPDPHILPQAPLVALFLTDLTGEKVALIGRVSIAGRATGKVISAAGGGSIAFRLGITTWANASTALDVGIQDVDTTTGSPVRPDGTYDVKRTLVPGTDTLTGSATNTIAMTGGTGSKTISHGDLIAVVFDMTTRAGADSVAFPTVNGSAGSQSLPTVSALITASWAVGTHHLPAVQIVFDDGTLAIIEGGYPVLDSAGTAETFADSTNPDERGNIFQVPWDCSIDAVMALFSSAALTGDFEVQIYSDPLGTPTSMLPGGTALTVLIETFRATGQGYFTIPLVSEISLTRNTPYCVAIKATGAGNAGLVSSTLAHEQWRQFLPGCLLTRKGTRNNGSGAFSETTNVIYNIGVRISGFPETVGGSGGASFSGYAM